jgi:ribosomal protein S4
MVRKLKYHEQKLLRKTDFITYKSDNDHRDKAVIRRYMIQKPEDYHKYNRICGVRFPPGPRPQVASEQRQPWHGDARTTT